MEGGSAGEPWRKRGPMTEEHADDAARNWSPPPSPDPVAPTSTAASDESGGSKLMIEQWVAIAAGAAAVVGAFMPWVSVSSFFGGMSRSGVDDGGDGLLTAGVGIVGAFAAWRLGKWLWAIALGGLVIAAVGVYDYADVNDRVSEVNADADLPAIASVGAGLYLTIAAGVVMAAAGVALWNKRRQTA